MKLFGRLVFAGMVLLAVPLSTHLSVAAPLTISDAPVFLGGRADPNIMFTLDDSGSMNWEIMPDALRSSLKVSSPYPSAGSWNKSNVYNNYFDPNSPDVAQAHSSDANGIFYDPKVRYYPWSNSDGSLMADALITCAHYDPMAPNNGTCVNFVSSMVVLQGKSTPVLVFPAHYFIWDGVGAQTSVASYQHVILNPLVVTYTGGPDRTDCPNAPTCTYKEEIQNFANWFQYYHTRLMTAKAGVGRAFAAQGSTIRVGFGSINSPSATIDGVASNGTLIKGVRSFVGTDRVNWFDALYKKTANNSTPLRMASQNVGKYFSRTDNQGPWGKSPGVNDPTAHSVCRQNYHILTSDGYWNGNNPGLGNIDATKGPLHTHANGITTYQYLPVDPYQDTYSDTLADMAMKYWVNDLRPDLVNAVPTNDKDPGFWQHMVTFTVGLGVKGTLDPAVDLPLLTNGTKTWPQASNNQIDDMWHAALNSHGTFFSARNATEFATALADQLRDIGGRQAGAAGATVSSTQLRADTDMYEARMYTGDWSGALESFPISDGPFGTKCPPLPLGDICPNSNWEAGFILTQSLKSSPNYYNNGRNIVTYDPVSRLGVPFRWNSLNATQQTVLRTDPNGGALQTVAIGQRRLDYLRGKDDSLFRNRNNYLGDIGYSSPLHIGEPRSKYPDDWNGTTVEPEDSAPYSAFVKANATRERLVYVGANDGMLHAFDAYTGVERFAYIPAEVFGQVDVANAKYGRLNQLSSMSYSSKHHYYVEGSPKSEDVFFGGAWHSVLVGGLRAGGRGIYALDVTSSTVNNETSAAAKVLWEFTDADDPDMGLSYGDPYIARLRNGKWAVVVGNGYNNSTAEGVPSATGHAVLFILFLDANLKDGWTPGLDYVKIDTMVGSVGTPNGLASPTVVDLDFDYLGDYIYAGDLQGNMWKFDITSTSSANWKTGYGTVAAPVPLFTATDSKGNRQPITTAPESGPHPLDSNQSTIIYFGTGKLIEPTDGLIAGQNTQTFYGIWDKNGTAGGFSPFTRAHLLNQDITTELPAPDGNTYRLSTNRDISWHDTAGLPSGTPLTTHLGWYMDLINTQAGNIDNRAERVIYDPVLRNGKIIFVTMLPSEDPCAFGGTGWLMELNAENGGYLGYPPFDTSGDGVIDAADLLNGLPPSGRGFDGIPSKPAIVKDRTSGTEYKYVTSSTGETVSFQENPGPREVGRRSWRQLQ